MWSHVMTSRKLNITTQLLRYAILPLQTCSHLLHPDSTWRSQIQHEEASFLRWQQCQKIQMLRHKQQAMLMTSNGLLFLHCANTKVWPVQASPCWLQIVSILRNAAMTIIECQHRYECLCCRFGSQCSKDCRGSSWPLWDMSQQGVHCSSCILQRHISALWPATHHALTCEHHQWMCTNGLVWQACQIFPVNLARLPAHAAVRFVLGKQGHTRAMLYSRRWLPCNRRFGKMFQDVAMWLSWVVTSWPRWYTASCDLVRIAIYGMFMLLQNRICGWQRQPSSG